MYKCYVPGTAVDCPDYPLLGSTRLPGAYSSITIVYGMLAVFFLANERLIKLRNWVVADLTATPVILPGIYVPAIVR